MQAYHYLKKIFEQYSKTEYTKRLLIWDNMVMMPAGAASHHAQAVALCDQMLRKLLITKKTASALDAAGHEALSSSADSKNLQWMEQKYQTAKSTPVKLLAKCTEANALAIQAWKKYKAQNNWKAFMPFLQKSFRCLQNLAEYRSQILQVTPYETLIGDFAPGLREKQIDQWVMQLKAKLFDLRRTIMDQQKKEDAVAFQGHFSLEKQKGLMQFIAELLGFDFNHGRIDTSHHPFAIGASFDMRITTCYDERNPMEAIFSIVHELGHGLYEQGMPKEWAWQPIGQVQDKALHESQALFLEYQVGHSAAFLEVLSAKLRELFGMQPCLQAGNLFKIINKVNNNLTRLDADEVSYPLHTILRYELEKALFAKEIQIADLPTFWNEKMQTYFGLSTEGNDKEGVMQDIHWSMGYFGYFPVYLLGQLIAAQLHKAFCIANPNFDESLKQQDMTALRTWLNEHIYSVGSTLTRDELLLKVSGKPLDPDAWIEHIRQRYCITEKF